MKFWRAILAMP